MGEAAGHQENECHYDGQTWLQGPHPASDQPSPGENFQSS